MPATLDLKTLPTCARCGRPVDKLTEYYDEFMARVCYVAHCHGERERVDIDVELLKFLGDSGISFGVAFALPPLLGEKND